MSGRGLVRSFLPEKVTKAIDGWETLQKAKAKRWWETFCELEAVDALDVEDEIAARVADGDERTIEAIKVGASAALEAADSVVLPSMALVARAYSRGEVPPWFMRGLLSLLSSVSAAEYGQLRDLVDLVERFMRECTFGPHGVRGVRIEDDSFETRITFEFKGDEHVRAMSRLHGSIHLFRELIRCSLAHEVTLTRSPYSIHFEPRVVTWLAATIPPSRDGNRLEYPPGVG